MELYGSTALYSTAHQHTRTGKKSFRQQEEVLGTLSRVSSLTAGQLFFRRGGKWTDDKFTAHGVTLHRKNIDDE